MQMDAIYFRVNDANIYIGMQMDAIYFRVNDANIYILAGSFNQKKNNHTHLKHLISRRMII